MPSITPNLRLSITNRETNKPFLNWRLGIDGPDDSNMIKLDKAWGDMKTMVDGAMAAVGHAYTAATVADMTDHDKSYVYVGSETGYTNGNWYYWNEDQSAWVSGGVYNATALQTDDTLTLEGEAADAKATGEMIVVNGDSSNGTRINITTTDEDIEIPTMDDVDDLKNAIEELELDVYGVFREVIGSKVIAATAGHGIPTTASVIYFEIPAGQEYSYKVECAEGVAAQYYFYQNGSSDYGYKDVNTEYFVTPQDDVDRVSFYFTAENVTGDGDVTFKVCKIYRKDIPLLKRTEELEERADETESEIDGMMRGEANPIAYTTITGYYIKHADGAPSASSGGIIDCTDYTDVSNYVEIYYRRNISVSGNPSSGIAFYDENKVYISGVQAAKNGSAVGYEAELYTAVVPDNAKYVRLSILADSETYGEFELYGMSAIVKRVEDLESAVEGLNEDLESAVEEIDEYLAEKMLRYTITGSSITLNNTETQFAADAGDVISFTPDGSSLADNQDVYFYVRYVGETNRTRIDQARKGTERVITLENGITAVAFYCPDVSPGTFTVEIIRKDKGIQKHITALETEVDGIVNGTAIVSPAERAETVAKLMQMKRPVRSSGVLGVPPLMLLHFSDIHGDTTNIARIAEFADEYADYLDDVICTGDMVAVTYAEDFRLMDALPGALQVIGNHETRVGTDYHGLSEGDTYTNYFARYISGWGAQYTSGKCYYYKDYTERNIRLIALDYIHESAEQLAWFADALAGAKTAGYTAVVCTHVSPQGLTSLGTPFNTKTLVENWDAHRDSRYDLFSDDYPAAVDTFIQGGGKFACWLTGHTHFGLFAKLTDHPDQITIAVPNAGITNGVGSSEAARVAGTRTQDCFHVVAIDDASSLVKVVRIGNDYTRWMEHPTVVCWDYANKVFAG